MFWGYEFLGLYQDQADLDNSPKHSTSAVGTIKYRDVNGDGIITQDDRTFIGNPNPKFIYGLVNDFTYKNFDLTIVVSGAYGGKVVNNFLEWSEILEAPFNVQKYMKDRWRSEENPGKGQIQRILPGSTELPREPNDRWIFDASYLTVRNITLGYKLPFTWRYLNNARIYASVQQAFVFTKYPGANPEVSNGGLSGLNQGVDGNQYPVPRTLTMGVNLNF
jgi:hypothetical protein